MAMSYLWAAFLIFLFSGCGIVPGGGRLSSDYEKTAHYTLSGSSQLYVKADWGEPDEVITSDHGETWVYRNRQDGKTFSFNFSRKGVFVSSRIDRPGK